MAKSLLDGKRILAVSDDPDILTILEEDVLMAAPACAFDRAANYQAAITCLVSSAYDLIILDVAFVRTLDLLNLNVKRPFPVPVAMLVPTVMLKVQSLFRKTLKRLAEMEVRVFLPKEEITEVVPLLEGVFKHRHLSEWEHLFTNLRRCLRPRGKGSSHSLAKRASEGYG